MKIYFWTLLIGFVLIGCESNDKKSEYTIIVDQIIAKYLKEVIHNDDFLLFGKGGGMRGGDIRFEYLAFKIYKNLELPELRRLIVEKEEQFLEMLNENKKIRFIMHDCPADSKNFELDLILNRPEGGFARPPYFATASVLTKGIMYNQYDPIKNSLETVLVEPYEEAYKIVYGHEKVIREEPSLNFVLEESQASK